MFSGIIGQGRKNRRKKSSQGTVARPARHVRPWLETLEQRIVPSSTPLPPVTAADFSGHGVSSYSAAGWSQLNAADASLLTVDASGGVEADFRGYGLYRYTAASGWTRLIAADASLLAPDASGDVVADFAGYGVYHYTAATGWSQLIAADASLLTADATGGVEADSGATACIATPPRPAGPG